MPMRYAGNGEWSVFQKPEVLSKLSAITTLPQSNSDDKCLVISGLLWQTFEDMSLWVEALCVQRFFVKPSVSQIRTVTYFLEEELLSF